MKHLSRKEAIDRLYKLLEPTADNPADRAARNRAAGEALKAAATRPEQKVKNG